MGTMTTAVEDRLAVAPFSGRDHKRLEHLDALRGIAAISVVANHYVNAFGLPGAEWLMTRTPLHIWWDGPAAVSFFFVLSGLVLSFRHFRTTSAPNLDGFSFTAYISARISRIWLPYLFVLLVSIPLVQFSAQDVSTVPATTPWFARLWKNELAPKSLIRQAFDLRCNPPSDPFKMLVPPAWTLTVEIVISLLVPLGIIAAGRSTFWFLGCVLIATTLAGMSPFAVHFAIGIALAKHYYDVVGWLEPRAASKAFMGGLGLILYSYANFRFRSSHLDSIQFDVYLQALGSALFIAVASASRAVRGWLSRGLVRHIGHISFSLYLIHMSIIFCLTPRVLSEMGGSTPILSWLVGFVFTMALSIAVSGPLYWYIEVPTMALGKRLGRILS
jgi:peptidoglycan/LPS O-acetylase OafA/YrhL